MSQDRKDRRWRGTSNGCGCGCASFIVVITLGLLLSLFNTDVGIGVSVRIPFTNANITMAGSVGKKDKAADALPGYVHGRLASNEDFVNQSGTLTIWVAEGTYIGVIGNQPGAPAVDLHVELR